MAKLIAHVQLDFMNLIINVINVILVVFNVMDLIKMIVYNAINQEFS